MNFEKKLKELEEIVETLDKGNPDLETLTEKYAEGIKLVGELRVILEKAEQKIIEIGSSAGFNE